MHPPPTRPWRTDIEGLRGLAILLVVLYHAGVPGFSGGYVGVDVFFVLSGYLITGILVREIEETGQLDLFRFYVRRARRLLPAAALLLISVSAFGFVYYAPLEQIDLAKTALASAAYVSNILFGVRATDYLAADAETNPLLHMWSLSVEEQFYLVWPALVLGLLAGFSRNRSRTLTRQRLAWGMLIVATASFALTLFLMATGQTHWAFFSSPTRVWEFALGGLVVLVPNLWLQRERNFTQILGWLGLAAVLLAGSLYTARTPFPSWAALLPVLGTLFILLAGERQGRLASVLSLRPLRLFGRFSYSWYLWHWPALVFARELHEDITLPQNLIVLALTLGAAALSYRFVENPVRRSRPLGRSAYGTVYGAALIGALALFSLGLGASWWGVAAVQSRSPEQARYVAAREDKPTVSNTRCTVRRTGTRLADCAEGPADAPFTVALFGDSHAAQWAPALQKIASERGWRLLYYMKVGCPGIDVTLFAQSLGRDYTECDTWRGAALDEMRAVNPDLVVMSSFGHYGVLDAQDWRVGSEAVFADLAAIAGSVVVIRDSPLPDSDVPACLSRGTWRRKLGLNVGERSCNFPARNRKSVEVFEAQQEAAREFRNVHLLDLTNVLCPQGVCVVQTEERILFRDYNHLTASYVRSLSGRLERAFDEVAGGSL